MSSQEQSLLNHNRWVCFTRLWGAIAAHELARAVRSATALDFAAYEARRYSFACAVVHLDNAGSEPCATEEYLPLAEYLPTNPTAPINDGLCELGAASK